MRSGEELDMIADDGSSLADRMVATVALKSFMHPPVAHRACAIWRAGRAGSRSVL